jgi:hypothetical protein
MKHLLTLVLLAMCLTTLAQPFIGIGFTNKGYSPSAGWLIGKTQFTAATKIGTKNTTPIVHSLSVGRQFFLPNNGDNDCSITICTGAAWYRVKDFTAYDADASGRTGIKQESNAKIYFAIELAQDAELLRWYMQAAYCGGFYFGGGVKVFFWRN